MAAWVRVCDVARRVEAVYQQCQRGVPTPSDAERSVSRELKQLGDVDLLKEKLDGLTAKFEYQKKQVGGIDGVKELAT